MGPAPRVVFFGSPPFATTIVERLVTSPHRPLAVVTQPERASGRGRKPKPSPVVAAAEAAGVDVLRPESVRDAGFRARLRALEADVFLVASYGELFDTELLELPSVACLNVHGSILPRWRGASPIQSAILAGDPVTGVTIQRMVEALDAGDVLLTRTTPIGPSDTSGTLFDRLAQLGAEAALEALDSIAAGRATFTPQDDAQATRCRKLAKSAGQLDWSESALALERRVRAVTPWPGARTSLPDGRVLGVVRARRVSDGEARFEGAAVPGRLSADALERRRLVVAAGEGALELLEVKPEGKRAMDAAAFLNGAELPGDARLGGTAR